MPGNAHANFSVSVLSPPASGWAQVRLSGDVDPAAVSALAAVIEALATAATATVYIDVADLTFADSTLPNFCVLLRASLPARASLTVCRPGPMTRWLLEKTGMGQILVLRNDLPLLDTSPRKPASYRNLRSGQLRTHEGAGWSAS